MKYLVFQDETAVVFANLISHREMAVKPVRSAGFCRIETTRDEFDDIVARVSCWGESATLGVKSHPETDEKTIAVMFRTTF